MQSSRRLIIGRPMRCGRWLDLLRVDGAAATWPYGFAGSAFTIDTKIIGTMKIAIITHDMNP